MRIENRNVFFCSDPHYNHKNLVDSTSEWSNKTRCRSFKSLEEHNRILVKNINDTVKEDDILFCLGDWAFGQSVKEFRDLLNVKEIHLIYGNHDDNIKKNPELQKLFESVQDYKEITIIDEGVSYPIVLCHYALRVWRDSLKGSIMLYGHSHNSLDQMTPRIANPTWIGDEYFIKNYRTMDVGFDTWEEFKPYSWEDIKFIFECSPVTLEIDHHEGKTT